MTSASLAVKDRLIIALDFPNAAQAQKLVQSIGDSCAFYKVGLELFAAEGPSIVKELVQSGKKVFLDLKIHEIPNSVAGAIRSAGGLGASMVTVHATGGSRMLETAAQTARAYPDLTVLAVTVLTSLSDSEVAEIGYSENAAGQVIRLAKLAKQAGCGGVVASPREVAGIRKVVGDEMLIVTPGIRPAGSQADDQQRIATPAEALRAGASHLVIGRPIHAASDPATATKDILREMEQALR